MELLEGMPRYDDKEDEEDEEEKDKEEKDDDEKDSFEPTEQTWMIARAYKAEFVNETLTTTAIEALVNNCKIDQGKKVSTFLF